MLRDLSVTNSDGSGILGTCLVGVLASELPTGFEKPGLLNNDVDAADPAGTLYRVEITSWPSAGTLTVEENGAFVFTDAPDGTYTGTEKVYKDNVPNAGTYSFTIGAAVATVTGVAVTPTGAVMTAGTTVQFSAVVSGTGSPSQGVTWTANGGAVTAGGLFTAPAQTTSAQTITVTATSTADPSKSGTATITVPALAVPVDPTAPTVASVTVTPPAAVLAGSATQQFSASVTGLNSPSQAVTWSTTGGVISSSGLLTTPPASLLAQTITVTATSSADPSKSGLAIVTVAALGGVTVQKAAGAQPVDASQAINRMPIGSSGKRSLSEIVNGLIDDIEKLRAANVALAAKLDADVNVTGTDYVASVTVAASALTVKK